MYLRPWLKCSDGLERDGVSLFSLAPGLVLPALLLGAQSIASEHSPSGFWGLQVLRLTEEGRKGALKGSDAPGELVLLRYPRYMADTEVVGAGLVGRGSVARTAQEKHRY